MKKEKQESEILNEFYLLGIKNVNLWGLSENTQQEILTAVKNVAKDFPCICDKIASISVALFPEVAWTSEAETVLETDLTIHIKLNARFFMFRKRFSKRLEEEKRTQYAAGIGIQGVVAHEIGHVLHYVLEIRKFADDLPTLFSKTSSSDITNPIVEKVKQDLGIASTQIRYYVSKYGAKNSSECIAECVSEYYTTASPRMFSCLVVAELKSKLL